MGSGAGAGTAVVAGIGAAADTKPWPADIAVPTPVDPNPAVPNRPRSARRARPRRVIPTISMTRPAIRMIPPTAPVPNQTSTERTAVLDRSGDDHRGRNSSRESHLVVPAHRCIELDHARVLARVTVDGLTAIRREDEHRPAIGRGNRYLRRLDGAAARAGPEVEAGARAGALVHRVALVPQMDRDGLHRRCGIRASRYTSSRAGPRSRSRRRSPTTAPTTIRPIDIPRPGPGCPARVCGGVGIG